VRAPQAQAAVSLKIQAPQPVKLVTNAMVKPMLKAMAMAGAQYFQQLISAPAPLLFHRACRAQIAAPANPSARPARCWRAVKFSSATGLLPVFELSV
jgi:hypothetical protein